MLQSLPDLLRDFALHLAFGEKTSDANIISIFTRQNRLYEQRLWIPDYILLTIMNNTDKLRPH